MTARRCLDCAAFAIRTFDSGRPMTAITHEATCPVLWGVRERWSLDFRWFRERPFAEQRSRAVTTAERDLVTAQEGWEPSGQVRIVAEQAGWLSATYSDARGGVASFIVRFGQNDTTLAMTNTITREKT